jgi:hypothetical protein
MDILNKCFSKGEDFVARDIAGETIIVPVRDGVGDLNSIYTLNELGTKIWQLIDGQTHVKDIVDIITGEYKVTEEEVTKDLIDYLDSLEAAGLIHTTGE